MQFTNPLPVGRNRRAARVARIPVGTVCERVLGALDESTGHEKFPLAPTKVIPED